jgi:hypothetical protein
MDEETHGDIVSIRAYALIGLAAQLEVSRDEVSTVLLRGYMLKVYNSVTMPQASKDKPALTLVPISKDTE